METIKGALLVPQRAIRETQGRFNVFVVSDAGEVQARDVELGPKIDRLQVVAAGVAAGDRVALDIMRLRPGMTVDATHVALDDQGVVQDVATPGSAEDNAPENPADA